MFMVFSFAIWEKKGQEINDKLGIISAICSIEEGLIFFISEDLSQISKKKKTKRKLKGVWLALKHEKIFFISHSKRNAVKTTKYHYPTIRLSDSKSLKQHF